LQTALSGLQAAQAAIDTTSENISNANTPGYTRQRVNLVENGSLTIPALTQQGGGTQLGTGVSLTDISRIRDQFLDVQYRAQNTATSNANTNASQLAQVQTAIDEPSSDGLQTVMGKFWSAWTSLGQAPTNAAAQQAVIDAGQTLASTFNAVSAQMRTVQSQAAQQYATLTGTNGQVQQDAQQIATLNQQISQATQAGQSPNTLLDQRDKLIDDLSGLAQVSASTSATRPRRWSAARPSPGPRR
jgi:flagellar hook-associated protein 1